MQKVINSVSLGKSVEEWSKQIRDKFCRGLDNFDPNQSKAKTFRFGETNNRLNWQLSNQDSMKPNIWQSNTPEESESEFDNRQFKS